MVVVVLLEAGGCYGAVDFCYEALEDFAGAELCEVGGTVGYHVFDGLCPAYGCGELCHEVGFDFGGVGVGTCVDVLVDGAYGGVYVGCLDCFGELGACGFHAGRVECAAYFEAECAFGSCCEEAFACGVDGFDFA